MGAYDARVMDDPRVRRLLLVELLGNDARVVGWIADDGRPLAERLTDGALPMASVAAGGLADAPAKDPAPPSAGQDWTPVRLEEVMIVIPRRRVRWLGPLGRHRQPTVARVGRFEVVGNAIAPCDAPSAPPSIPWPPFLTVTEAHIRHVDHLNYASSAPRALLNRRYISAAVAPGRPS